MNLFGLRRKKPAFSSLDFVLGLPEGRLIQEGGLRPGGSVAFMMPGLPRGSGGHTSILRLGTKLTQLGYEVKYVVLPGQRATELVPAAHFNLPYWEGSLIDWKEFAKETRRCSVGVATLWSTCYFLLKHAERFHRKAYFIQDYEPYFYPIGDEYCLSEHTYFMGLEHRSLGAWNLERIAWHTGVQGGVALPFPVEVRDYPFQTRRLQHGRTLRMAVYLREEARRAGSLISMGLEETKRQLAAKGVGLDVRAFGMADKTRPLRIGDNLGKLNRQQLRELYSWADFGVVGSLTNISLINYEMIACGLPVLDFEMGSARSFFSQDEILFAGRTPESLYAAIETWHGRERDLEQMVSRCQQRIQSSDLSWDRVAREFAQSLSE